MYFRRQRQRGPLATQVCGLVVCLLTTPAAAVEVRQLDIRTEKGSYEVDMVFSVAAQPAQIITLLTDYGYPDRLNPEVTAKEILAERDGSTRVRTEFRGCAVFLCKDLALVQDVAVTATTITADVVPGLGDFSSGRLEWHISANGVGGTDVEFSANMNYEFFVVPVFGQLMLRKRLKDNLLRTAENLEAEASRLAD